MAGIPLSSQFSLNTPLPLDDRDVVTNITARNAIASGRRYQGMMVYVASDQTTYQLRGGVTNADWYEFAAGGGGGGGSDVDLSQYLSIDDFGSLAITLRAKIMRLVMEDELGAKWIMSVSNLGEIQIESGAGESVTDITLMRDDTTLVCLKIFEERVIVDTTLGAGELIENCYLSAANGLAWRLKITNDNEIYLVDEQGNTFSLKDDIGTTLFKIKQTVDGTMHETRPFVGNLPTPTPDTNNIPFVFHIVDGIPVFKYWDGNAWKTFMPYAPAAPDPFPVGHIEISVLTLAQFLVEINDPEGERWKIIHPDDLPPDCRLTQINGWRTVPDSRGMFLRGDQGGVGTADPGYATRVKHEGLHELGSYQADCFGDHFHGSVATHVTHTDPFGQTAQGGTTTRYNGTNGAVAHPVVNTSYASWIHGTAYAGPETRSKNIAVNFFLKYNN